MFTKLLKLIHKYMARELKPIDVNDKVAAIEAIMNYKKQNPVKFEQKKEALFAKYGLNPETLIDEVKDSTDELLETAKKKAKKAE